MSLEVETGSVEEMKRRLQTLLAGNDYWVIVSYDEHSTEVMKAIEERFYKGEGVDEDFSIFISAQPNNPLVPVLTLACAHKRRLSVGELAMFHQERAQSCPNPEHRHESHQIQGLEQGDRDGSPILCPVTPDPSLIQQLQVQYALSRTTELLGMS